MITTLGLPSVRVLSHLPLALPTRLASRTLTILHPPTTLFPLSPRARRRSLSLPTPNQRLSTRLLSTTTLPPPPGPSSSSSSTPPPEEPTTASAKLKQLFTKYGRHAIGMYILLSTLDFTLTFALVHLAGAEKVSVVKDWALEKYHFYRYGEAEATRLAGEAEAQAVEDAAERKAEEKAAKKSGGVRWLGSGLFWTEVALAYGIHKTALLPIRIGLTVAWTPKVVAWLTRRGWIGKGGITRAAAHASDKVKTARSNAKEKVKDMAGRVKESS